MRLDGITRVERFIVDALLSSPQIPVGTSVMRLAAIEDQEGVVQQGQTIVVRYEGSTTSVSSVAPLTTLRTLSFVLTISAQSYLQNSGHDYAVQMCAGAINALTNAVPSDTGFEVFQPMSMSAENFQGLTENTIYVYEQTWQFVAEEVHPIPAFDPCVARGNCSYLFPNNVVSILQPAEVIPTVGPNPGDIPNRIYAPVLPAGVVGAAQDPRLSGTLPEDGSPQNLVYTFDQGLTFIDNWEDYRYVSQDQYTGTNNEFLLVNIFNKATGALYRENVIYSSPRNRRMVYVDMGLYRSPIDKSGNIEESGGPENIRGVAAGSSTIQPRNGVGIVVTEGDQVTIYSDPMQPETTPTAQVPYGEAYFYYPGVELVVNEVVYTMIGGTPLGRAWIRSTNFEAITNYDPARYCEEPEGIGPLQPEGGQYPNTGRLE